MDYDKLIEQLWNYSVHDNMLSNLRTIRDAATAIETLCAALARVTAELNNLRAQWDMYGGDVGITETYKELERVKAERDGAVEAVKNMAEYIVCAGRVDYYLCDEISQEHHLKYQPKNDGSYDNEPCYKCIADWFLQGHKWQGNCW